MEEKEKEGSIDVREKHQLIAFCLLQEPQWGSAQSLQPRHVPWLGIEPATFQLQNDA